MPTTPVSQDTFRFEIEDFSGINTGVSPIKMALEELKRLENFELKVDGYVGNPVTRNGFERYNTNDIGSGNAIISLFEHKTKDQNYLIAKSSNGSSSAIKYLTNFLSGSPSDITTSEDADKPAFVSANNNLYVGNRGDGEKVNMVWDGDNYEVQGCPPAGSLPSHIAGVVKQNGGSMADGLYSYIVTFLYDNGQESAWMPPAAVSTISDGFVMELELPLGSGDNQVLVTLPDWTWAGANSRIIGRRIYRTKVYTNNYNIEKMTFYKLVTILNNSQATYLDNTIDDVLGAEGTDINEFLNMQYPFKFKKAVTHKNRMFCADLIDPLGEPLKDTDEITLVDSSGGSMQSSVTYKYRIRKLIVSSISHNGTNGKIFHSASAPLVMSILMGSHSDQVEINFVGTAYWNGAYLIERTEGGGDDFYPLRNTAAGGIGIFHLNTLTSGYIDTVDDTTLIGDEISISINDIDPEWKLPNGVIISEPKKPDLYDGINLKIIDSGNDGSGGITDIHSEDNRVVIFKNNSIHKISTSQSSSDYWYPELIFDGIGATKAVQLPDNEYLLISSSTFPSDRALFYHWNGVSAPVPCDKQIYDYLNGKGHTIYDACYDKSTNDVKIVTISNSARTEILKYDLDLRKNGIGTWSIAYNDSTDLAMTSTTFVSGRGTLLGNSDGYLYWQSPTTWLDWIGGSKSGFKQIIQTRDFGYIDADLVAKKLLSTIEGFATGTADAVTFKYGLDNTTYISGSEVTVGQHRIGLGEKRFVNKFNAQGKRFYFKIEINESTVDNKVIILKIGVELERRHRIKGGNL